PGQGDGRAHRTCQAHQLRLELAVCRSRRLHAVRLSARRDPGSGPELRAPCHHRRSAWGHVAVRRHRHHLGQHHRRVSARIDSGRACPRRGTGIILRDVYRRHAGDRGGRQRPPWPLRRPLAMSDMPLHAEAPAPIPKTTKEIDRTGEPVFELRSVSHRYGRNRVIFDVSLSVWPGEVVALVGDNGAGKSTLLKIFAGYQQPTAGTLRFMGKDVRFRTPADARAMGIEAVYQDLAMVDQLSLWRNFFLGKEIVRKVGPLHILVRRQMREEATAAISELGLTRVRSAEQPVWTLSGGERQSVAITRAMHFGAKLLLLDEPTAALSVRETRNVLASIGRAREHGLGILYIDHNMSHVLPIADRIVLLELGRVVRVID